MAYIGQRPVIGRYIKLDQISSGFNGSNTGFSMTAGSQAVFPGTARNLLLSLGGVIQEPDTDFTISGSTLTFTTPPVANTTFFGVIYGDMQATGTPSDGTVLPASIASSGHFKIPQLTVNEDGADVDFRVEGDTEANLLFVDAGEDKVGIGTGTPSGARLHIVGSGNTGLKVQVGSSSADQIYLGNTGGASSVGTLTNVGFNLIQNGGVALAVDTSKNVGIGTTSPTGKLHINSGTTNTCATFESTDAGAVINITDNSARSSIEQHGTDLKIISDTDAGDDNSTIKFQVDASTKMTILSSGNVGIGETSPAYPTEIKVSDTTAYSQSTTASSQHQLRINNAGLGGVAGILLTAEPSSGSAGHAGIRVISPSSGKADMTFSVRDGGTYDEKLRILNDGKVGIGTTSPSSLLHLHSGASSGGLQIQSNGSTNYFAAVQAADNFITGAAAGSLAIRSSDGIYFSANDGSAVQMSLLTGGNVGIGTTSPAELLHLQSTAGNTKLRLTQSGSTTDALNGAIHFGNSTDGQLCEIRGYTSGSNNSGYLQLRTTNSGSDVVAMTINTTGNVGIGTTSPATLLHLSRSSTTAYDSASTTNDSTFYLQNSGAAGHTTIQLQTLSGGTANTGQATITAFCESNSSKNTALTFATRDNSGNPPAERMRIQSNGRVGIGNTGPKAGLHVATENTTYGKNAVFGANGWVNNANYHYTDATISLLGQDADGNNKGAGIEFSTRNTANTNWRHGAINQERDSDLVFILGGSGTFQGVERLRIKGNGLMAFNSAGTVNATYQFDYAPATGGLIVNANAAFTGNSTAIQFRTAPSTVSGNITLTNNGTTTAYGTSSDYRLKENAVAISDGITRLKTLKPYRFNFKSSPATTVDGFFAHEVTAVPEAITGTKDETKNVLYTEEDTIPSGKKIGDVKEVEPVYQSMDYAKITPLLTAALQEAITKIETLESEVAALKAA